MAQVRPKLDFSVARAGCIPRDLKCLSFVISVDNPEPCVALWPRVERTERHQRAVTPIVDDAGLGDALALNLTALSLLAMAVGLFLVFNAQRFVQSVRRPQLAQLIILGLPPSRLLRWLVLELLILATLGTLCLLNGLVTLHGGNLTAAFGLIGAATLCTVVFVMWQRVQTQNDGKPLMNLSLFTHRPFAMGTTVAFIYGIAMFGSTYLLPLYLQLGLGLSPSYVGTLLLPSGLLLALTIAIVGRYSSTHPTHLMVSFGLVLLALSFALMLTVNLQTGLWVLVVFAILGRIGLGFILPSLNIGAMRGMDGNLIPQGASVINFLRMLGGAAGVSLCGILLEWRLAVHGDSLKNTATSVTRLAAFDEVFLMLAGVCMLALLAAWRIRQPRPHAL